jgi:uncharacterized protein YggU (UPF0235/DUF167 family)
MRKAAVARNGERPNAGQTVGPVPWAMRIFLPPGPEIQVRVTPEAAANRITFEDGVIRDYAKTVPEDGTATAAGVLLMSKATDVAKSHLALVCGVASRDKLIRVEYQTLCGQPAGVIAYTPSGRFSAAPRSRTCTSERVILTV